VLKLAIFDIDGTLTATNAVDSECYGKAVSGLLGDSAISTEWERYPEVTDQSLLEHLCRERLGRLPTPNEIRCAQEALVAYFATVFAVSADAFAAIQGAPQFVRALGERPDWLVVLATGAWECSAQFKLRAVGLGHLPLVACDTARTRAEIVQKAIELSSRSGRGLGRIVLVGDAPWDLATAEKLHLPFVGVASGDRRKVLIQKGASHVLSDFSDIDTAMEALETAREPAGSAT
jgi:phosphoglycolate phosphatase-like HAD superfamily hydrolase